MFLKDKPLMARLTALKNEIKIIKIQYVLK